MNFMQSPILNVSFKVPLSKGMSAVWVYILPCYAYCTVIVLTFA